MKIVVANNETGSETEMKIINIDYGKELRDDLFSVENLKEASD